MSKKADMVRDGIEAQKAEIRRSQDAGEVKAAKRLAERAESYSRDARTFADAGRLGKPVIDAESDERLALIYRTVADELRKVAAALGRDQS